MSKGSKRRQEDFSRVQNNWEYIDWSNTGEYCYNCGIKFNQENLKLNPDSYTFLQNGEISHKNCNFN